MAENRLRIAGLASDDTGCGHYRLIHPLKALSDAGHDTVWSTDPLQFMNLAEQADVVILQRCTYPPIVEQIGRWKRSKLVIYELDDLLHCIPPDNPSFRYYKPGGDLLKHATRAIVESDGMIVSSYELWKYYQRYNRNIIIIPNFIDFKLRDWQSEYPRARHRIVVGWSGGSQHQPDAQLIASVLRTALEYPQVDIGLYCHPHFAGYLMQYLPDVPPERVLLLPVRPFRDYPYQLGAFDIAIAPVANNEFNRAKCLHSDTPVWTPAGMSTIGALKPGDWVWNGERYVHVLAVHHDGGSLGMELELDCGLSVQLTPEHRVLTSIGWLNAGKLRRGDRIQLAAPNYSGYGEKRYSPQQAAEIAMDNRLQFRPHELFSGWSNGDMVAWAQALWSRYGGQDRRGRVYLTVRREVAPFFALALLLSGRGCRANWYTRSVRFTLLDEGAPEYSSIRGIRARWIDAVDIQVEGELFCANGVVSHNSSLKPLEYMARGVPCIASDVAEYRLLYRQGAPFLLANTMQDWRRCLDALITQRVSPTEWVQTHYDLHQNVYRYEQAIQQFLQWKREGCVGKGQVFVLERKHPCPCGSGERYGRCCYPVFG